MNFTNVTSKNLKSVGFDIQTQTLQVNFINGRKYQYYNVPENVYDSLLSATSKGTYLRSNIIGKYNYKEI